MKHKLFHGIVTPLTEEKALQLGSTLITEFMVFSLGVSIAVWQFSKQSQKETAVKSMEEEERKNMLEVMSRLAVEIEKQEDQIAQITKDVKKLRGSKVGNPLKPIRGQQMLV
jgi:hypothetical protein